MESLFVDTSAFVALEDTSDQDHGVALRQRNEIQRHPRRLITTNFIFDETYTLLLGRLGHKAAVRFGRILRRSRVLELIRIAEDIEDEAWDIAQKYGDKTFSFTDCTSFAVMRRLNMDKAFAFDHHFVQFGFITLP